MGFAVVFDQVSTLFILMGVGFLLMRLKLLSAPFITNLTDVVFFVAMPALVVVSFQIDYSADTAQSLLSVAIASFLMHAVTFFLGFVLYRKKPAAARGVLWSDLVFTNSVFMGYPILQNLYGAPGLLYASINCVFFQFFLWSFAPLIFSGQLSRKGLGKSLLKAALHPGVLCTILGVVLFLTGWRFPEIIQRPISLLGNMATPASMLLVGAKLGQANWRELRRIDKDMVVNTALRLVVLPIAVIGFCWLFGMRDAALGTMLIVAATPMATSLVLFAERFGADSLYASRLVVFTTVVSLGTLPLMLLLLPS